MSQTSFLQGVSLEKAKDLLLEGFDFSAAGESLNIEKATGRVLAEDVYADINQPPFPRSPLDGYAVCASDLQGACKEAPVELRVVGRTFAGDYYSDPVACGQAVRIMTGAPIPSGCDGVIRQEDTDCGEERVKIYTDLKAYKNYCFEGEDYKVGEILVEKGSILTPERIGIIASTGRAHVLVGKKMRVGILATGAELIDPGQGLKPGKIYNSNAYALYSRLIELGCQPELLDPVGDDLEATVNEIRLKFDGLDVILTTGGVSVGLKDIMPHVHEKLGAKKLFWKLKLKPGSPALASIYKGKLLLSLSGNPMASGVTFELLFADLLSVWMQASELAFNRVRLVLSGTYNKQSKMRRFIKAKRYGNEVIISPDKIASGNLKSTVHANCLIDIPANSPGLCQGGTVEVIEYRRA